MDIRQLEYFVAIAEELSFTKASQRLHVSQPPLSIQIKRLEQELGGEVFIRMSRGVSLTPVGVALLKDARNIISSMTMAKNHAREIATGHAGTLRIGFVASASDQIVPRLIKKLSDRFAKVEFELTDSSTAVQIERLKANAIDVGIVRLPVDDAGLSFVSILKEPFRLVVSEKDPLAKSESLCLREIRNKSIITFPRASAPSYHDILIFECKKAGFSPVFRYEIEQIKSTLDIVASGLGVSVQPKSVANIRSEGLAFVPLDDFSHRTEICAVFRNTDDTPLINATKEACRDIFEPSMRM